MPARYPLRCSNQHELVEPEGLLYLCTLGSAVRGLPGEACLLIANIDSVSGICVIIFGMISTNEGAPS